MALWPYDDGLSSSHPHSPRHYINIIKQPQKQFPINFFLFFASPLFHNKTVPIRTEISQGCPFPMDDLTFVTALNTVSKAIINRPLIVYPVNSPRLTPRRIRSQVSSIMKSPVCFYDSSTSHLLCLPSAYSG